MILSSNTASDRLTSHTIARRDGAPAGTNVSVRCVATLADCTTMIVMLVHASAIARGRCRRLGDKLRLIKVDMLVVGSPMYSMA